MNKILNYIKQNPVVAILVLLHLVGIIGMRFNFSFFSSLSPLFLLTVYLLLFTASAKTRIDFWIALFLIAFFGFSIEVAGVETGLIFGDYQYLNNLGPKIFHVPILIGVNWAVLIYASNQVLKNQFKLAGFKRYFFSSMFLVCFDWLIEQNAPKLGFWVFHNNWPGFSNYLAWFLVSFILSFLFGNAITKYENRLCLPFLLIQAIFFILLNFL